MSSPLRAGAARRPQRTIRFWLACLVCACAIPASAATLLLLADSYGREHRVLQTSTIGTARALMQAVDRDLANVQMVLQLLATSPLLAASFASAIRSTAGIVPAFSRAAGIVTSSI